MPHHLEFLDIPVHGTNVTHVDRYRDVNTVWLANVAATTSWLRNRRQWDAFRCALVREKRSRRWPVEAKKPTRTTGSRWQATLTHLSVTPMHTVQIIQTMERTICDRKNSTRSSGLLTELMLTSSFSYSILMFSFKLPTQLPVSMWIRFHIGIQSE